MVKYGVCSKCKVKTKCLKCNKYMKKSKYDGDYEVSKCGKHGNDQGYKGNLPISKYKNNVIIGSECDPCNLIVYGNVKYNPTDSE